MLERNASPMGYKMSRRRYVDYAQSSLGLTGYLYLRLTRMILLQMFRENASPIGYKMPRRRYIVVVSKHIGGAWI